MFKGRKPGKDSKSRDLEEENVEIFFRFSVLRLFFFSIPLEVLKMPMHAKEYSMHIPCFNF